MADDAHRDLRWEVALARAEQLQVLVAATPLQTRQVSSAELTASLLDWADRVDPRAPTRTSQVSDSLPAPSA